jgi:hypothetical protein
MGLPTILLRPMIRAFCPARPLGELLAQQQQAAERGAGRKRGRIADTQSPGIQGMKTVHVFRRIDRLDHPLLVDVLRQGQLHQDTVHRRIAVQIGDQRQQFTLAGRGGQLVLEAAHARGDSLLALVAHVYLAGGVTAHQHHGKSGLKIVGSFQSLHFLGNALAERFRPRLAINAFCGHLGSGLVCG